MCKSKMILDFSSNFLHFFLRKYLPDWKYAYYEKGLLTIRWSRIMDVSFSWRQDHNLPSWIIEFPWRVFNEDHSKFAKTCFYEILNDTDTLVMTCLFNILSLYPFSFFFFPSLWIFHSYLLLLFCFIFINHLLLQMAYLLLLHFWLIFIQPLDAWLRSTFLSWLQ